MVTSSIATIVIVIVAIVAIVIVIVIVDGNKEDSNNNKVFTEEDWTDLMKEGMATYYKTKTLTEKVAWEFVADLPFDEKILLVTLTWARVSITGPSESMDFGKA